MGDLAGVVGERVDQREPDRVRFGARTDLAGDPGFGLGEVDVGVTPQRVGVLVELELSGGPGVPGSEDASRSAAFASVWQLEPAWFELRVVHCP